MIKKARKVRNHHQNKRNPKNHLRNTATRRWKITYWTQSKKWMAMTTMPRPKKTSSRTKRTRTNKFSKVLPMLSRDLVPRWKPHRSWRVTVIHQSSTKLNLKLWRPELMLILSRKWTKILMLEYVILETTIAEMVLLRRRNHKTRNPWLKI